MGKLKLKKTWVLNFYQLKQLKQVILVKKSAGYYVQFLIRIQYQVKSKPTGKIINLYLGLKEFYTDSNGYTEPYLKFYSNNEKRIMWLSTRLCS